MVVRLVSLGTALAWLIVTARSAEPGTLRRRQVVAALATVVVGALGAVLRFLPVVDEADA